MQQGFLVKRRLENHIKKRHLNRKTLECDTCHKTYADEHSLKTHKAQYCSNNGYRKRWANSGKKTKVKTKHKKSLKIPKLDAQGSEIKLGKGRPKGSLGIKKRRQMKKMAQIRHKSPEAENLSVVSQNNLITEESTQAPQWSKTSGTPLVDKTVSSSENIVNSTDKVIVSTEQSLGEILLCCIQLGQKKRMKYP